MAQIESLTTEAIIAMINNGTWPTNFALVTTPLTASAQTAPVDVSLAGNVTVQLKNTGTATMSTGTFVFEASVDSTNGSDGTWVTIQGVRSDGNTIESQFAAAGAPAAGAGPTYGWEIAVNGYKWFRIRCTATPTASSIASWMIARGAYATDPVPAVPSHAVTVTGTTTATPGTATEYNLTGAASNNAAFIKASAGNLYEISVFNPTAAIIYLKLYNKASAPTVGTDVPKLTIAVPVNTEKVVEFGAMGKRFGTGIAIATTTGAGATDNTAPTAGIQISASYL